MTENEAQQFEALRLEIAKLSERAQAYSAADGSALKAELASLKTEFGAFRDETRPYILYAKFGLGLLSLLIAVFGFLGYRGWDDIKKSADSRLQTVSDQTFEMAKGLVLSDTKRHSAALMYLTPAFARNHYDEQVTAALLYCLDQTGDYARGLEVVKELRSDPSKFLQFHEPVVYSNVGNILLYSSLDEHFRGDPQTPLHVPPDARAMYELSLAGTRPDNDYDRFYMLMDLGVYYFFADHDLKKSKEYLESAQKIVTDEQLDDATMAKWFSEPLLNAMRDSDRAQLDELTSIWPFKGDVPKRRK